MSSEEVKEKCGEPLGYKDGKCENTAKYPDGSCGFHTTKSTFEEKDWKPTYDHGIYVERGEYYKEQSERDQKWIDAVADDLIEKSYYDREDLSMFEKCRQIAVDLHQRRSADGYVAREGLTQEKTVGYHEDYGEVTETQENTLMITKDRLSRESRLAMKDLGIMDEEHQSKNDESAKSLLKDIADNMD